MGEHLYDDTKETITMYVNNRFLIGWFMFKYVRCPPFMIVKVSIELLFPLLLSANWSNVRDAKCSHVPLTFLPKKDGSQ